MAFWYVTSCSYGISVTEGVCNYKYCNSITSEDDCTGFSNSVRLRLSSLHTSAPVVSPHDPLHAGHRRYLNPASAMLVAKPLRLHSTSFYELFRGKCLTATAHLYDAMYLRALYIASCNQKVCTWNNGDCGAATGNDPYGWDNEEKCNSPTEDACVTLMIFNNGLKVCGWDLVPTANSSCIASGTSVTLMTHPLLRFWLLTRGPLVGCPRPPPPYWGSAHSISALLVR